MRLIIFSKTACNFCSVKGNSGSFCRIFGVRGRALLRQLPECVHLSDAPWFVCDASEVRLPKLQIHDSVLRQHPCCQLAAFAWSMPSVQDAHFRKVRACGIAHSSHVSHLLPLLWTECSIY